MNGGSVLSRLTAALADRYRIARELGVGGMATVYLAEDLRHRRNVAVKVLHPELTALLGPDRFLKEIELTAALQHPHILPLFDSGAADGLLYYVMPYVEGETLRSRLSREHQLPLVEALRIAGDVADALEYAHKRGVIHRDIKPENILLHEGRPQVADFGIALAVQHAGGSRMTQTGMSLGTPQYMAPEQAMGDKSVDARADVYALGAVTYEMLTGEPPFTGPTAQAIVAKVMTEAPQPLAELRKTVPHHVNDAVLTALEKLPADRFASTSEFARALQDPAFKTAHRDTVRGPGSAAILRNRSAMVLVAGIALTAAGAGAALTWSLRKPLVESAVVARFELPLPDSAFIPMLSAMLSGGSPLFPTRDGRLFWATTSELYERSLDGLTSRRVRDLDGATNPAILDQSPDGAELLTVSMVGGAPGERSGAVGDRRRVALSAVPLRGGPSRVLVDSADFAAWGSDGFVYYTYYWPPARKSGLARVPAQGGAADTLATFGIGPSEDLPQNLTVLPNGRGLVVTLGNRAAPELAAFDLRSRTWHRLGAGGPDVGFVEPGYLIYGSGRSVMAAPFDLRRLAFAGPPLPLAEVEQPSVRFTANGGVLAFRGSASNAYAPPLVIHNRRGESRVLPNVQPGRWFSGLSVSPDGKRFVVEGAPLGVLRSPTSAATPPPSRDLFVYQLPAGPMSRLPTPQRPVAPTWLPGGREIGFTRVGVDTPRTWTVMRQPWDGSGAATPVYSRPTVLGETSWLPDGKGVVVLYLSAGSPAGRVPAGADTDIGLISLDRPDSIRPLVVSPAYDGDPAVSPDGRYLAYRTDESGRDEVWVRPVAGGKRRQVSLDGGSSPRWAWNGRELYFYGSGPSGGMVYSAQIRTAGELSVGTIAALFPVRFPRFMPAPLPGDSLFVGFGGLDETEDRETPVVILVNLEQALARLFAGGTKQPQ
ncbi:MAG TPA: protein kinase [Gemmatimonadales bacterium]